MLKRIKKRSNKAGLPPGTLVHLGERKAEEVKIRIMNYDETHFEEKTAKTVEECFDFKERSGVTWIDISGIHEIKVIEKIGNYFGLHPLTQEDILNTDQRPKVEDFDNYIYIVLKILYCGNNTDEVVGEQVSLVLGANFVISFQEREGDVFDPVRDRIKGNKGLIRKMGLDYLTYSLLDCVVDGYFIILERLGEKIEFLEEELLTNPTNQTVQIIHDLKTETIFLRRSVWPLREVISRLQMEDYPFVKDSTKIYLKDVYDHTIQIIDTIESQRDMLSGMLDIYLSSISNKMNAVMKALTIIATIFLPLTFIAGVYGMNFKYMPELEWQWSYFIVLAVMGVIGISMFIYFKIKKWV